MIGSRSISRFKWLQSFLISLIHGHNWHHWDFLWNPFFFLSFSQHVIFLLGTNIIKPHPRVWFLVGFHCSEARIDLGKTTIDKEVVEKVKNFLTFTFSSDAFSCSMSWCRSVISFQLYRSITNLFNSRIYKAYVLTGLPQVWDRIAPGLASQFDSPFTVPAIAPRPQLILTGIHINI